MNKTVKIQVRVTPAGAPYDFTKTVDTGLTREQWDACPTDMQEAFGQAKIAELLAECIDTDWCEEEQ